jgi:hypothetical protein
MYPNFRFIGWNPTTIGRNYLGYLAGGLVAYPIIGYKEALAGEHCVSRERK